MNRVDRAAGVRLVTDSPHTTTAPVVDIEGLDFETPDVTPEGLRTWAGRSSYPFHVQGLVDAEGRTYITAVLNDLTQTWEVAPGDALEAFLHPFANGCTLPL